MPIGVFKTVREVSSEDGVHLAANLLQENASKKWKTKSIGEKSAYVILEFEEAQEITGIDIGNEHAAFIEVLVSKTGCNSDDFHEMLLSSSFMTPIESKNSTNTNRVRCFAKDSLCSTALPDKWKLVKIICSQPFNRHVQYGLSFIKVHVIPAVGKANKPLLKLSTGIGTDNTGRNGLKLREESPDSDAPMSLFQRWKANRNESESTAVSAVSTAAAIRDAGATQASLRRLSEGRPIKVLTPAAKPATAPAPASTSSSSSIKPASGATPSTSSSSSSSSSSVVRPLDRNRQALLFGNDEDAAGDLAAQLAGARQQRLNKHIEADKNRRRLELEQQQKAKNAGKRVSIDRPVLGPQKRLSSSLEDTQTTPAKKPKSNPQKSIQYLPFNQLLRGVVLVISGIQNPDRANLRDKALALGAKYKADWETGCTHLICAFKNTPKYNQVKGKGKIVTRSWIEKCYDLKKYLPWRRYAIDTMDLAGMESDEELYDESLKPAENDDDKVVVIRPTNIINTVNINALGVSSRSNNQFASNSSDPDTEDELARVAQNNRFGKKNDENKNNVNVVKSQDIFEVSTDEEDYLQDL